MGDLGERSGVDPEQLLNGGQVICGRNDTRRLLNAAMKQAAGFRRVYPEGRGEKIICLKNRHDLGLVNGMFLELCDIEDQDEHCFSATRPDRGRRRGPGPPVFLQGPLRRPCRPDPDRDRRDRFIKRGLVESVWGFAITCHKAQGSQWENVIVLDDGLGRTAEDRARWLYTAITRAERGLVLLMSAVVIDLNDVAPFRAERPRFDLDLIVARLRDTAETWVPRLFPNGRRLGDEWRLANIRGDAPRNSGSCVIALKGAHAGDWIDFDGDHGGGPISTIEQATGLTGYELFAEAAEIAGVAPGAPQRQVPAFQPAPRRDPAQEIDHILAHAVPIAGTLAERYLAARGLASRTAPTCCSIPI